MSSRARPKSDASCFLMIPPRLRVALMLRAEAAKSQGLVSHGSGMVKERTTYPRSRECPKRTTQESPPEMPRRFTKRQRCCRDRSAQLIHAGLRTSRHRVRNTTDRTPRIRSSRCESPGRGPADPARCLRPVAQLQRRFVERLTARRDAIVSYCSDRSLLGGRSGVLTICSRGMRAQ